MFRKVIHITFIVLLLATSAGMTFYSHYCGNKLESVTVNATPDSCCGDDCNSCHNKTLIVKINDDYSATTFTFDFHLFELAIPAIQQLFIKEPTSGFQFLVLVNDLPPPPIQTILSSLQTYRL